MADFALPSPISRPAGRIGLAALVMVLLAAIAIPLGTADAAGGEPIGHLDSVKTSGNTATIRAWAIDRDTPTTPVTSRSAIATSRAHKAMSYLT